MADNKLCRERIISEEYADFLIDFLNDKNYVLQGSVPCVQHISEQYRVLHIPFKSEDLELAILEGYYNTIPKLYGLMETSSLEDTDILKLRRVPYLDLLGQNVLVGIIDTGIDYLNPLFINEDNTTRIKYLWDQSENEERKVGNRQIVPYGTEYRNTDINEALRSEDPLDIVPEVDADGHGTFLSGIVGGKDDIENDFTGIAPLSNLVVVKLKPAKKYLREFFEIKEDAIAYQENDIMSAVSYLLTKARDEKKPISILIGLGTSQGDHDGNSILSSYLNSIANIVGVCVTTAAGNEGNSGHHYQGNIPYDTMEEVEIKVGENDKGMTVELWALSPASFSVGLISPSGEKTNRVSPKLEGIGSISFVLEPTTVQVAYALTDNTSGNELIFLRFSNLVPGIWKIIVHNEADVITRYDMWLPCTDFLSTDTYFLKPDPDITLVETGTTAKPICTGTYNHKNNSIYISSSRGYTLSDYVKPDIVAPGVNIYGPIGKNRFGAKSGSSIAAAHSAGVAALFLQWGIVNKNKPSFNTSEVKAILIKGANRENRTYPNQEWGYGRINAYNAFDSLRNSY